MINQVISQAVKIYLRSQVERVEDLQVKITGGNRQILKGHIPAVFLASSCAVYQGLHLREIEVEGINISFNLADVLKKKPLKLLAPVPVSINLLLEEADLQASLVSPLLASGLTDFLSSLLSAKGIKNPQAELADCKIDWLTISLSDRQLQLQANLVDSTDNLTQLNVKAGLTLANSHTLCLSPLTIETIPELLFNQNHQLEIDLGTEVAIAELSLESGKLVCSGEIMVLP